MTDETTPDLITWLRAQLDDDERWARAASQTYPHADEGSTPPATGVHWRWVAGENWETVTPDPAVMEFVEGPDGTWAVKLATVEEWPSTTAGRTWMMPRAYGEFVEMDASAAGHIARHDPARVLAEVDAKRRLLALAEAEVSVQRGSGAELRQWKLGQQMLRVLALPYADRDGYRPEWRP